MDFLGFSIYKIMASVNRDSFTLSYKVFILSLVTFLFLSLFSDISIPIPALTAAVCMIYPFSSFHFELIYVFESKVYLLQREYY